MAKIKYRRKTILAKIEPTYGTDAVPTAALNAILTGQFEISPWEGESLERDLDRSTFGSNFVTRLGKHVTCRFRIEAAGSGTPVTPAAWDPVMQAAGHSSIVDATVGSEHVTYAPIDVNVPALTFYFHHDTKLHKFLGSRGSMQFIDGKRTYPYFQFEFMGLYVAVADGVMPTPDTSAFVKPVPFRASNVTALLFVQTIGLHSLTLTGGQSNAFYEHSEEESIQLQDRNASFEASFEEPSAATHDFWADADAETSGVLDVTHGTVAGNIIQVKSQNVQISTLGIADENGIRALTAQGPCVPDGGNPEYEIITK